VLLLIDTDRLASEVRLEQADAAGEAFPHVYGTVNLDAVFEAAPYRPGADGRFQPHEEASGFAAHGAATLDQAGRRAVEAMAGYPGRWWVAGGWALDLALGRRTRPHADLEVSVLAADQQALFEHLRGWDLRAACHSCARRSRCCSRPRHPGSRISETSTASSHTLTGPPAAGWPRPWNRPTPTTPGSPGCSGSRRDRDRRRLHRPSAAVAYAKPASCALRTTGSGPRSRNIVVWHFAV